MTEADASTWGGVSEASPRRGPAITGVRRGATEGNNV